jgi:hypothetical protein
MSEPAASQSRKPAGTVRKVFATILDFIFIFWASGMTIGYFSGHLTKNGFDLNGGPALLLFAVIVLYFIIFRRYLGGTLFQRLLRAY